jgi:Putative beta-barrel porin 2
VRLRFFLLAVACLLARAASAQDGIDPEGSARFHLGPMRLAPSVTVSNLGVDTNVFNEETNTPRSDFTATITTKLDSWWRVGRARLNSTNSLDFVYFNQYVGQRSVNPGNQIHVEMPLNRFKPYASVSVLATHQRTAEIDVRAASVSTNTLTGSQVRLTGKLALDINGGLSRTAYKNTADPLASALHFALTSHAVQTHFAGRYAATPLTTVVLAIERRRDLFDFSSERNSESVSIKPGIEFKPFALVSGSAYVGYRRFRPMTAVVPGFAGTVADVNLAYTLLGTTRLTTQIQRDINFSFESTQPYYLLTGTSASVDRNIAGPWDAIARMGRQKLAYRSVVGSLALGSSRTDIVANYGGSLGYRIAHNRRIGVDFDYVRRRSGVTGHNYQGLRFGISATYPL